MSMLTVRQIVDRELDAWAPNADREVVPYVLIALAGLGLLRYPPDGWSAESWIEHVHAVSREALRKATEGAE